MTERIPQGTKEELSIVLKDKLGALNDLAGTAPKYDVYDPEGTLKVTQGVATSVGMEAFCLIDTTTGTWAEGDYQIFINFSVPPLNPRLGPFVFRVTKVP
jgi:hypothetical protein